MQLLFAISLLCFLALILATVAIARQVRSGCRPIPKANEFAYHLFSATRDQNSRRHRTLELETVRDVLAEKRWNHHSSQANARTSYRFSKPF
jgi:hypothetical protein